MSNVLVDKYKIDVLANAIANKSSESVPMTLSDMVQAVDSIDDRNFIITFVWDSTYGRPEPDCTFEEAVAAFNAGKTVLFKDCYIQGELLFGYIHTAAADPSEGIRLTIFSPDMDNEDTFTKYEFFWNNMGAIVVHMDTVSRQILQSLSRTYTPTTSTQTERITYSSGYNGINYVDVTVNPTPSQYSATPKEVNFYDYDGTVVDSYTASEFAALSAMPANPTHDGLTAQGWNWSLADAQAYVAKYGRLNIGQMYVTTSGDTEIDIQLGIGRNKPYLGCCPNGTVEIDWGDGSAHDTLTGDSISTLQSIQHTYPDTGEPFTITLHMESGSLSFLGLNSSSTGSQVLYNGSTGQTNGQRAYQNAIKEVRFGSHVTSIAMYAFYNCYSLASVMIPEGVTSINSYAFSNCYTLRSVTIPEGVTSISTNAFATCRSLVSVIIPESVTSISTNAFNSCNALASVTIPEGMTSIGQQTFYNCYSLASVIISEGVTGIGMQAFNNCYSLASVTIPEDMTNIGANAFNSCSSLAYLTFKPTTPPTVPNANTFSNFPTDGVVYVPAGTLSAYQNASNYTNIKNYMVEMSA